MKDGKHIVSVGNGRRKYTLQIMKKEDKYRIPPELCLEILNSIELSSHKTWTPNEDNIKHNIYKVWRY